MKYPAILGALYNRPQLITADKLNEIHAFMQRRLSGEMAGPQPAAFEFDRDSGQALGQLVGANGETFAIDQMPAAGAGPQEFVAVLPLFGTIFQHAGIEMECSGGTSTEAWQKQLRKLDANAAVKTVVIEAHTPGGQCIGTEETANLVREIRDAGRTRIISVVNSQMASAGVWIGTAANKVYVTPGGEIGSIGVVTLHWDYSKAYEESGIKPTLVATSRKKILGNEFEPLDEEALAEIEAGNQAVYQRFVKAMAANRGVTPAKVESDFGGGGMLWAKDAVKAGLADGVATMAEVLEREVGRLNKSGKAAGRKSGRNKLALEQAKQL
jgi:ClpP class serine protease